MSTATIPLTRGVQTLVDDEDYAWLSEFKWMARPDRNGNFYAVRDIRRRPNVTTKRMHREILGLADGDVREGDHINGNTLDNRRSNLRACTTVENARNRGIQKNNTTGYKGVSASKGSFVALIGCGRPQKYLGTYSTAEEAALAYDIAALGLYGEFARTNLLTAANLPVTPPTRLTHSNKRGHNAALSEDEVRAARAEHANGETYAALGRLYGISDTAMSNLVRRKTYRWVA